MPFPKPSFKFDRDDQDLIKYVQRKGVFGSLGDESKRFALGLKSRNLISKLDATKDLTNQREVVKALWPELLTDAFRQLKRHAPKEWNKHSGTNFNSFFNRDSLGISGLQDILDAFTGFEPLLYGARPDHYRDHIVHVLRVWIIGYGLLQEQFSGKLSLEGYLEPDKRADSPTSGEEKQYPLRGIEICPEEWACMWTIAALCHDIGYPLASIEHINTRAGKALKKQGLQAAGDLRFVFSPQARPLQDTFMRLMASKIVPSHQDTTRHTTHLQNKYYLKFLHSFDQLQHGVVSALLIGSSLVYFLESDFCHDGAAPLDDKDAHQFLIRREILRAVAAHTCPDIYHLQFDTISFLLYIIDELQGWGRPTFEQYMDGLQASSDEDVVEVENFTKEMIEISIEAAGDWNKRKNRAQRQLKQLARRLRLAVGTSELHQRKLLYSVKDSNSKERVALRLESGKIRRKGF